MVTPSFIVLRVIQELGRQTRPSGLSRSADSNFVPDANYPGDATHVRLCAGLLIGPFDHPFQGNDAAIDFYDHSVTRDREIPIKRVDDFDKHICHGAPFP